MRVRLRHEGSCYFRRCRSQPEHACMRRHLVYHSNYQIWGVASHEKDYKIRQGTQNMNGLGKVEKLGGKPEVLRSPSVALVLH